MKNDDTQMQNYIAEIIHDECDINIEIALNAVPHIINILKENGVVSCYYFDSPHDETKELKLSKELEKLKIIITNSVSGLQKILDLLTTTPTTGTGE